MQDNPELPPCFVWTKCGTEAGEELESILARKESERIANGGVFLWGVGNNVARALALLLQRCEPEVLFTGILGRAREVDVAPTEVLLWRKATTLEGNAFEMPAASVVTSRGGPFKRAHFALICESSRPLGRQRSAGAFHSGSLRNLASGRPVGSSQVTSVVERGSLLPVGREYNIAMRLFLRSPYFLRLSDPVRLPLSAADVHRGASVSQTSILLAAERFAVTA